MKIRITHGGIFGANGEIAIGTELNVKEEPTAWAGRYAVLSKGSEGKTAIANPAEGAPGGDTPKTAEEVLKLADGQFMTFKSAATKLLGDKTPSTKAEIITALEELATQP
jgi:hypothetical protein